MKLLLAKCGEARGKDNKVKAAKEIFSVLSDNKWFLETYSNFRNVVHAKLVEFVDEERTEFLPAWQDLYDVLRVGVEREVRVKKYQEELMTPRAPYPTPRDNDEYEQTLLVSTGRYPGLTYAYRERDRDFKLTGITVMVFGTQEQAEAARLVA